MFKAELCRSSMVACKAYHQREDAGNLDIVPVDKAAKGFGAAELPRGDNTGSLIS